jgi:hypothetical protein
MSELFLLVNTFGGFLGFYFEKAEKKMAVHVLGRKKNLKFKINNLAQKSQKG